MSYIFEALQRAEAERSGGSLPRDADSVAELLQQVEQEIDRKQALSELPAPPKLDLAPVPVLELKVSGPTIKFSVVRGGRRAYYNGTLADADTINGIVTVTAMQWLNGGQYVVAILPWLMLGWADRPAQDARD